MNATMALMGNPNSGKTTLFNSLTGSRQHVGNYPGITVEKREGRLKINELDVTVVDLPGTYSLTAYTQDEVVARKRWRCPPDSSSGRLDPSPASPTRSSAASASSRVSGRRASFAPRRMFSAALSSSRRL